MSESERRARIRLKLHAVNQLPGWLTVKQYADRYGMTRHHTETLIHASIIQSRKYRGLRIVKNVPPPPKKENGRYVKND